MSQPKPQDTKDGSEHEEDSTSSGSEHNNISSAPLFDCDAAAIEARKVGLVLFNRNEFELAVHLQETLVEYFTKKYGQTSCEAAVYCLDYGITLLNIIQCREQTNSTLHGPDEDDCVACFECLELARVGFQKHPKADEDDAVKERLAEVHDSLAHLFLEQDNNDDALKEFEEELLLINSLQVPNNRLVLATMFAQVKCYLNESDYEGAHARMKELLAAMSTSTMNGLDEQRLPEGLTQEIQIYADDIEEHRGGKFQEIQLEIQELFPKETEDDVGTTTTALQEGVANKFLSTVPAEFAQQGSCFSLGAVVNNKENSTNSTSRSFFPPQQGGADNNRSQSNPPPPSSAGPVNVAVVRKKPKQQQDAAVSSASQEQKDGGLTPPVHKKARMEGV